MSEKPGISLQQESPLKKDEKILHAVGTNRIWGAISTLIFILLGGCLGGGVVLGTEHLGAQVRFYGWMAIIAAVASALLLIAILGSILRWIWRHRGQSFLARARESLDSLIAKPVDVPWSEHLPLIWIDKGRLLWNTLLITLTLWTGIALLSPLITGLFSFASYLSTQAQVEVTHTQNHIVAIEQEFQQANAYAQQRFEQIASVLLNADASTGEQVFALREVPDAMRITVPRAEVNKKNLGGIRVVHALPNLERLRAIVRQYISMDRVSAALRRANISFKDGEPLSDEAMEALKPLAPTSTELFHLLHCLGPADKTKPELCLWSWLPISTNYSARGVPEVDDLSQIPKARERLNDKTKGTIVLSHLRERDVESIVVPYAFEGGEMWNVVAGRKLSFSHSEMQGADLSRSNLQGCNLSGANVQGGSFYLAEMGGADLSKAYLQQNDLAGAQLNEAELDDAQLQGADLSWAQLPEASLRGAQLQGADLVKTNLYSADLRNVNMQWADLTNADMARSDMTDANLQGADLSEIRLGGAVFVKTYPRISYFALINSKRNPLKIRNEEIVEKERSIETDLVLSWMPEQTLRVRVENKPAFLQALVQVLEENPIQQKQDLLRCVPHLSRKALSRICLPLALESSLKSAVGNDNVKREWYSPLVGKVQTSFDSYNRFDLLDPFDPLDEPGDFFKVRWRRVRLAVSDQAVWMTDETFELILESLNAEPYLGMAKESPDAAALIQELREELVQKVNYPGNKVKFSTKEAWTKEFSERSP